MEEYESISITKVFEYVKKYMILILILSIVGGVALGGYTILNEEDTYQCSGKLIISKESAKVFYEDHYTQSDILMYEKITNTYVEIAKSNAVLNEIVKKQKGYNKKQIKDMVTVTTIPGTLILQIDITGRSSTDVYTMTNAYLSEVIQQCAYVMPVGDLIVLDEAELPLNTLPSCFFRNLFIGIAAGAFLGCAFVMLRMFLDSTKIQDSKQIKEYLELEVQSIFS